MTNLHRSFAVDRPLRQWCVVGAIAVAVFLMREKFPWLVAYPESWVIPVADWINTVMNWFVETFRWFFQAMSWLLGWPLKWIQGLLHWLPWPATIFAVAVLAYAAAGWKLAVFSVVSLLYMVLGGYWDKGMNTLSLVFVAVPLAVVVGLFLGIAAYRSPRIDRIVQPALDLMQTVPTFAYLIPILLLFGFGAVVGLIASAIYACPPMVRNTILGLRRVPSDVIESGVMSGATRRQLLWMVRVPSALPTLMIGVNQTVMAGLAMVIIAAIIGSSADIGWEVLSTMRKAFFGESLFAGLVIVLIAMLMDRISRGFAQPNRFERALGQTVWQRHRYLVIAIAGVAVFTVLAQIVAPLKAWPTNWVVSPADYLNDALNHVLDNYSKLMDAIKRGALFFFLLPIKIGFEKAISPFSWGFKLTPLMSISYGVAVVILAALTGRKFGWRPLISVLLIGAVLFFGFTNTPWPVFILVVTLLAWQVGGWRVGTFSLAGMMFMLLAGVWPQAMLSVYLCSAAVLTSFLFGGALGVWAAQSDRVSAFIRPINDTLQTIPLFVFLIPVLMFFRVGDFTAFLAIIMYAIVPPIRYTEHGLRNVDPSVIEAARAMGCTRWQMLFQVKLPLALPELMLGLNQTIMFGLAMLVITALVGTKDLGQSIYIALGKADPGAGLVAGLGMAFIAMIADRIIQSWSNKKRVELGLG
ncbi:MAG: glycine/betaine ABC transporter permease [Thiotrichales bacterium]|nr:glycine/betaine ABC transporter permease [Thiotrichales bacterium]